MYLLAALRRHRCQDGGMKEGFVSGWTICPLVCHGLLDCFLIVRMCDKYLQDALLELYCTISSSTPRNIGDVSAASSPSVEVENQSLLMNTQRESCLTRKGIHVRRMMSNTCPTCSRSILISDQGLLFEPPNSIIHGCEDEIDPQYPILAEDL